MIQYVFPESSVRLRPEPSVELSVPYCCVYPKVSCFVVNVEDRVSVVCEIYEVHEPQSSQDYGFGRAYPSDIPWYHSTSNKFTTRCLDLFRI